MIETRKRSWVKAITFRVLGIITLGILAWIFTHDWSEMTLITITFNLIRIPMFYIHERWWERVKWGRNNV